MTGFDFVLARENFQTLRDPSISSSEIIIFRCSDIVEITASSVFSVFLVSNVHSHQRCSKKKVFLKISQNSQENTCDRVSFLIKLQALWTTASLFSNFLLLADYFVGCILMFIFYEGRFTFSETIRAGWKLRPDFHSCLCNISMIVLFQKIEQKKLTKKKSWNFFNFLGDFFSL